VNWGPYTLQSILHEGGEGATILGFRDSEQLALKFRWRTGEMNTAKLRRLQRLAKYSQHVLSLKHWYCLSNAQVTVSDYLVGVDVRELIADAAVDLVMRLSIIRQLLSALDVCHEHGFIHADLHSGNLRVTRSGRLVVLDIEGMIDGSDQQLPKTDRGWVNPQAMTPEQYAGESVSPATDGFAAVSLIAELLTGYSWVTSDRGLMPEVMRRPELPDPELWTWLPVDQRSDWRSQLQQWWNVKASARPGSLRDLRELVDALVSDPRAAQTKLAARINELVSEPESQPVQCVLPEFEAAVEPRSVSRLRSPHGLVAVSLLLGLGIGVWKLWTAIPTGPPITPTIQWVFHDTGGLTMPRAQTQTLAAHWQSSHKSASSENRLGMIEWGQSQQFDSAPNALLHPIVECGGRYCFFWLMGQSLNGAAEQFQPIPLSAPMDRWRKSLGWDANLAGAAGQSSEPMGKKRARNES
jgi:serine/threonine protein kinase